MTSNRSAGMAGSSPGPSEFVVVANRLPVDEVITDAGRSWRRSPGGLVTALHPVLVEHHGAWIGWSGGPSPDGTTAVESFEADSLALHAVPLSAGEIERYYEGFSNGSLWPRTSESALRIAQSSFACPGAKPARLVICTRPSVFT